MMENLARLLDKAYVILRKDFLSGARYRTAFAGTGVAIIAELAAFYFLARSIGPAFRPQGMGYFSFLLVGMGFYTFLMMGIHSFLSSVQEAQQTGTLEVLMTSRTSPSILLFLAAVSSFSKNILRLSLYLAAGLIVLSRGSVSYQNLLAAGLAFILSTAIAVAIGMMAAAMQLATHKGSAVMWLLGTVAWLMTGTMFPVTALPQPLLWFARLIPLTHCLNALRLSLIQGQDLHQAGKEILILAAFSLVLFPAGLLALSRTLKHARLHGTLSFY